MSVRIVITKEQLAKIDRERCPSCHGFGGLGGSYSSSMGYDDAGNFVYESSKVNCVRCNGTGRIPGSPPQPGGPSDGK